MTERSRTTLDGLPAAERVLAGIADLAAGDRSADALVVAVAAQRLREAGLAVPRQDRLPREPELELYAALALTSADPYYAYRAALAESDSFIAALERRRRTREPRPA